MQYDLEGVSSILRFGGVSTSLIWPLLLSSELRVTSAAPGDHNQGDPCNQHTTNALAKLENRATGDSDSYLGPSSSAPPPRPVLRHPQPTPRYQPQTEPRITVPSSLCGGVTATESHPQFVPVSTVGPYATSAPTHTPVQSQQAPKPAIQQDVRHRGPWDDEEIEHLKTLAELSKRRTSDGTIDWDWTADQFGPSRTRYAVFPLTTRGL